MRGKRVFHSEKLKRLLENMRRTAAAMQMEAAKRLEQNRFFWPVADEATGSVMVTQAQLSMLIEGIDWRSPDKRWRPAVAG